jgi:isocitrate/isopropylmalate dehydrogenase
MEESKYNTNNIKNAYWERRDKEQQIASRLIQTCSREYMKLANIRTGQEVHLQEKMNAMSSLTSCFSTHSHLCNSNSKAIHKCHSLIDTTTRENFVKIPHETLTSCTNVMTKCLESERGVY